MFGLSNTLQIPQCFPPLPCPTALSCTDCISLRIGEEFEQKPFIATNNCSVDVSIRYIDESNNIFEVAVVAPGDDSPGFVSANPSMGDPVHALLYAVPFGWNFDAKRVNLPCAIPFIFYVEL